MHCSRGGFAQWAKALSAACQKERIGSGVDRVANRPGGVRRIASCALMARMAGSAASGVMPTSRKSA